MTEQVKLMDKKALVRKINGIGTRVGTIRDDVHAVLCHAAGHAFLHGDVSSFTRIIGAAQGMKAAQIVAWAKTYGFVILKEDGTARLNKAARNKADFTDVDELVSYLLAEPKWYELESGPTAAPKPLDVAEVIKTLAKNVGKAPEKGREVTFSDATLDEALDALRTALVAEQQRVAEVEAAEKATAQSAGDAQKDAEEYRAKGAEGLRAEGYTAEEIAGFEQKARAYPASDAMHYATAAE